MSKDKETSGGYSYTLTDEQIDKYKSVPISERLRWIEETNRFLDRFTPEANKKLREKLRKGEL